jgi:hypothetical protein
VLANLKATPERLSAYYTICPKTSARQLTNHFVTGGPLIRTYPGFGRFDHPRTDVDNLFHFHITQPMPE